MLREIAKNKAKPLILTELKIGMALTSLVSGLQSGGLEPQNINQKIYLEWEKNIRIFFNLIFVAF